LSILALALPFARVKLAEKGKPWGAELEVLTNLLAVGLSALLIGDPASAPLRGLFDLSVSSNHLAAVALISAILLFMATGGTHLVRGVLARVDAVPRQTNPPETGAAPGQHLSLAPTAAPAPGAPIAPTAASSPTAVEDQQLDVKEYNRGRVIGIIERTIMTAVVAVGAYAALMFLIGAKGLIRSHELEKHEFAEYFLIGTLASAAVAIVFGLMISGVIRALW
jgi:hypothetical protein